MKPVSEVHFPPFRKDHSYSEQELTNPFSDRIKEIRKGPSKQPLSFDFQNDLSKEEKLEVRTSLHWDDKRTYEYKEPRLNKLILNNKEKPSKKSTNEVNPVSPYIQSFIDLELKHCTTKRLNILYMKNNEEKISKDKENNIKLNEKSLLYKYEKYQDFMNTLLKNYCSLLKEYNQGGIELNIEAVPKETDTNVIDDYNNITPSPRDFKGSYKRLQDRLNTGEEYINTIPVCCFCQENAAKLVNLMTRVLSGHENFFLFKPYGHFCEKILPISFLIYTSFLFNKELLSSTKESKKLYKTESLPRISVISLSGQGCDVNSKYLTQLKNFQFFEFPLESKNLFQKPGEKLKWSSPLDNQYILLPLIPDDENLEMLKTLHNFRSLPPNSTNKPQSMIHDYIFEGRRGRIGNNDFVKFFTTHIKSLLKEHAPDLIIFHLNLSVLLSNDKSQPEGRAWIDLKAEGLAQIFREISLVCERRIIFIPTIDPIAYLDIDSETKTQYILSTSNETFPENFNSKFYITSIFASFIQAVQLWNVPNKIPKKRTILDLPDGFLNLWASYYFHKSFKTKSKQTSVILSPNQYKVQLFQSLNYEKFSKTFSFTSTVESMPKEAFLKRKELREKIKSKLLNHIVLISPEELREREFVKVFLFINGNRGEQEFYYSKSSTYRVHYFSDNNNNLRAYVLFINVNFEGLNCCCAGVYTFKEKTQQCFLEKIGDISQDKFTNFGLTSYEFDSKITFAVYGGIPTQQVDEPKLYLHLVEFEKNLYSRTDDERINIKKTTWERKLLECDHGAKINDFQRFDCSLIKLHDHLFIVGGDYLDSKWKYCTEINYINLKAKTLKIRRVPKLPECTFYPMKNPLLFNQKESDSTFYMIGGYLNEMLVNNNFIMFDEWPLMRSNTFYDKSLTILEFHFKFGDDIKLTKIQKMQKYPKYHSCESINANWLSNEFFGNASTNIRKFGKNSLSFKMVASFFGREKNLPWPLLGGPNYLLGKKLKTAPNMFTLNNYCITFDSAKSVNFEILSEKLSPTEMGYMDASEMKKTDLINESSIFVENGMSSLLVDFKRFENDSLLKAKFNQDPAGFHHYSNSEVIPSLVNSNITVNGNVQDGHNASPDSISQTYSFHNVDCEFKADEYKNRTNVETLLLSLPRNQIFIDSRRRIFFLSKDVNRNVYGGPSAKSFDYYCYICDISDIEFQALKEGNSSRIISIYYTFILKDLIYSVKDKTDICLCGMSLYVDNDVFVIAGGVNCANLNEKIKGVVIPREFLKHCIDTRKNIGSNTKYVINLEPPETFKAFMKPIIIKTGGYLTLFNPKVKSRISEEKIDLTLNYLSYFLPEDCSLKSIVSDKVLQLNLELNLKDFTEAQFLKSLIEKYKAHKKNTKINKALRIKLKTIRYAEDINTLLINRNKKFNGDLLFEISAPKMYSQLHEKILILFNFDMSLSIEPNKLEITFNEQKPRFIAKGYDFKHLLGRAKIEKHLKGLPCVFDKEIKAVRFDKGDIIQVAGPEFIKRK